MKSEEKMNYKERDIESEVKMNYKERNIEKWREIEL